VKRVTLLFVLSFLLLVQFGCATKEYVKQQIDPLIDRISRLEAKVTAIESRVNALEGKMPEIDAAKKDAKKLSISTDAMKTAECCDKADAAARGQKLLRHKLRCCGLKRHQRKPERLLNYNKEITFRVSIVWAEEVILQPDFPA
jgi:outer membrane murein-binding lipoprotein Lpp